MRLVNSPVYTHSSSSLVQDRLHVEDPSQFSQVHYSADHSEHSNSINTSYENLYFVVKCNLGAIKIKTMQAVVFIMVAHLRCGVPSK